jgi:hypothetical protein
MIELFIGVVFITRSCIKYAYVFDKICVDFLCNIDVSTPIEEFFFLISCRHFCNSKNNFSCWAKYYDLGVE